MTGFSRGLDAALATTKRTGAEVLRTQARGVVTTLMRVTPPANGVNDTATAARRRGEASVRADVSRVIYPVRRVQPGKRIDPAAAIERRRGARTGRVSRGERYAVEAPEFRAELARRLAEVGKLAAGWAPAARRLGVRVPAWINRHGGDGFGGEVMSEGVRIRVLMVNGTIYARAQRDLERRVQWALDEQGRAMERAASRGMHEGFRRAGFEVTETDNG